MGTYEGWLFFILIVTLFSWGVWMGLMGIAGHRQADEAEMPNGSDAMIYYNPNEIKTEQWRTA